MNFLFKLLIKNYKDVEDPQVRHSYGKLAGIVGIVSNLILCIAKYIIGFLSNSIAILAEGTNNLTDTASSVVTLVGFKLSSMPEDNEHPYGHARIEYISGMIVSILIIIAGIELGKESFMKILHPEPVIFRWLYLGLLLVSILVKLWQARFNIIAGTKIDSIALIATGQDSKNDVFATIAVMISLIIGDYFHVAIDGYMGLLVSAFIIYSGISLSKETISPLLGEAPTEDLVKKIEEILDSYPELLGYHDLIVHNYGHGKTFASFHVEVDSQSDILSVHEIVDHIERRFKEELNIFATGHADPIDLQNPNRLPISNIIENAIEPLDGVLAFHDLRIVPGRNHTNVILDVVLSPDCKKSKEAITKVLSKKIQEYDSSYHCIINYDIAYTIL